MRSCCGCGSAETRIRRADAGPGVHGWRDGRGGALGRRGGLGAERGGGGGGGELAAGGVRGGRGGGGGGRGGDGLSALAVGSLSASMFGGTRTRGERRRIAHATAENFFFEGVPQEDADELMELMEQRVVPAGQDVILEGDPGEHYFVLEAGYCDVVIPTRTAGKPTVIRKGLGPGDSFGEMSLIYFVCATSGVVQMLLVRLLIAALDKDGMQTGHPTQ